MNIHERIAKTRAGWCSRCNQEGVMLPADVTTFTLSGTTTLAGYKPELWDGFKCSCCGNEVAIGKEDAPAHVANRDAFGNPIGGGANG